MCVCGEQDCRCKCYLYTKALWPLYVNFNFMFKGKITIFTFKGC